MKSVNVVALALLMLGSHYVIAIEKTSSDKSISKSKPADRKVGKETSTVKPQKQSDIWLGEWLGQNNPLVIKYLEGLATKDIGQVLKGVTLTTGEVHLKSQVYIGKLTCFKKGVNAYLFANPVDLIPEYSVYLWREKGATKITLPSCIKPGIPGDGNFVLSGDVYTWKNLEHDNEIVINDCPPSKWIDSVKRKK